MSSATEAVTPFNPLKLLRHADVVERMLRDEVVYPVSVELDLSNTCNHGCPWCSFNGFRQENWVQFPSSRLVRLLEELADVGVKSVTFTGGGEPLVHKEASAMFRKADTLGLDYGVVTNGVRLVGAAREEIARSATFCRVSLDAGRPQTHQLLHATVNPEFSVVLENLMALRAAAGRRLTIGASMCIFDVNVDEILEAAQVVKSTGANYLEVRPVFPTEWRGGGFSRALSDANVDRAKQLLEDAKDRCDSDTFKVLGLIPRFDQVATVKKPYQQCRIGGLTTIINATGMLYHCCVQRGQPDFALGSILEKPFKEVWDALPSCSSRAKAIDVAKCPPCRYDGFNTIVERAFIADDMHSQFL